METQETHLIVVIFCGVYNGDVSGLKRLPCILETVVQLLGDAKSARAFFGRGLVWNGRGSRTIMWPQTWTHLPLGQQL